jgi:hypothetical protein
MEAKDLRSLMMKYRMEDSDVAESLQVRVETVFKWRSGKKKIPDHYGNIMDGWKHPEARGGK